MKSNFFILILFSAFVILASCDKDDETTRFGLLTENIWDSDSLLINGVDASSPGGMLENFKGEARFQEDGTGTFGGYTGTWRFAQNETELVIQSDSLPFPLSTKINELSAEDLKVSTSFPDFENLSNPPVQVRLTFKAR